MVQTKYPNKAITKPQIKKIHTLVSSINMPDDLYRSLLFRYEVESSTELNRADAAEIIEILIEYEKELNKSKNKQQPTGIYSHGRTYYLPRTGKATNAQIDYILGMWKQTASSVTYPSLMKFVQRVTGKLYLHIESLGVKEASNVILALESWSNDTKKQKGKND